ncbi:MAG TPA: hypothetical protein ENI94_06820 [Gammaproteobacteria bacterium]|nr:hypothetical protein [Gammaproteobacteria bacterium]
MRRTKIYLHGNDEVDVLVTSRIDVEQVSDWLEKLMQRGEEGMDSVSAGGDPREGLARLPAPQL